ncbi:MAG TPA: hypothetical protein VFX50_12395, partial [Gemmatimonadales bacterium]|nr:hypothetical protein [Gemmatimonadales bacterium]
MRAKLAALCASALMATVSVAAPVSVGRASFETPADQAWVVHALEGSEAEIKDGARGPMKMANVALWLPGAAGTVDALLLFVGSEAPYADASLVFPDSCAKAYSTPSVFVRNGYKLSEQGSLDDCLIVARVGDLMAALQRGAPLAAEVVTGRSLALPQRGYVVRAIVAQRNTRLAGMLFVSEKFRGLSRGPRPEVDTGKVPVEVVR